ncbi:MAG TPA: methylated-DNA--[protein]-cysteine S-methyltransferase [Candidatus Limnocylindria bacterium]|nr:methylated-DNA--[protein]-cysteine S-methyltransferase [Candidatus Limnocylindria bacterium]
MPDMEQRLSGAPLPKLDGERLMSELGRRAQEAGLADVAYASMDSPVGELLVAVTERGVVRVAFSSEVTDEVLAELAQRVSPRLLRLPERTDTVRRELDEYFEGKRHGFDLPLDWSLVRGFARGVLHATARVPFGQTTTYRQMAEAAGSPRASRAAGNALGSNPIPIVVPCHRVLHSGGGLGGYAGGLERKRTLLTLEGVLGG